MVGCWDAGLDARGEWRRTGIAEVVHAAVRVRAEVGR